METEILQQILEPTAATIAPGEIVIGSLTGIDDQGQPLVCFGELSPQSAIPAISTIALHAKHIGRGLALLFAEGDLTKPVIIGLIHNPLDQLIESFEVSNATPPVSNVEEAKHSDQVQNEDTFYLDGKKLVFEGKEEIVLKCGDSSITLTRSGKILIRGKYLLSRSTGVNRILGGSVQVN